MKIELEKYDSITIGRAGRGSYTVHMVHEDHTYKPGSIIDTDDIPYIMEVSRKYKSLFITDEHKESLDMASDGMTTTFTQINRK